MAARELYISRQVHCLMKGPGSSLKHTTPLTFNDILPDSIDSVEISSTTVNCPQPIHSHHVPGDDAYDSAPAGSGKIAVSGVPIVIT